MAAVERLAARRAAPSSIRRATSAYPCWCPAPTLGPSYTLGEDGTIAYAVEGLRVEVRYMTDRALNARWPQESSEGPHSYNAYTYGDYVDPQTGYVRNRFTVFAVSVYNLGFPKVELQPLQSRLTTNRRGEELAPYGTTTGSAAHSFESYYRALKGVTGNEDYRFDMRMGQVRTSNYGVGEKIYKGENYSGFIVFEPLADEVEEVRLHLRDFILKFNAFDQPLQTFDMDFRFVRQIEQLALTNQTRAAALRAITQARLQAPSEVSGYAPDDLARTPATIDAFVRSQLDAFNRCFAGEFPSRPGSVRQRDHPLCHLGQWSGRKCPAPRFYCGQRPRGRLLSRTGQTLAFAALGQS